MPMLTTIANVNHALEPALSTTGLGASIPQAAEPQRAMPYAHRAVKILLGS